MRYITQLCTVQYEHRLNRGRSQSWHACMHGDLHWPCLKATERNDIKGRLKDSRWVTWSSGWGGVSATKEERTGHKFLVPKTPYNGNGRRLSPTFKEDRRPMNVYRLYTDAQHCSVQWVVFIVHACRILCIWLLSYSTRLSTEWPTGSVTSSVGATL